MYRLDVEHEPSRPDKRRIARAKRKNEQLEKIFGGKLPDPGDEKDAPPVDEELIQGFIDETISQEAQRRVAGLIWRFHSWAVAWGKKVQWREGIDPEAFL